MAPPETERTAQWSVLDRLIDTEPDTTVETPRTWAQSVRDLRRAVRRDLEWLLNTRRIIVPAPEELTEVARSLYHFGLPDVTALGADSASAQEWLRRRVEDTISLFEPRLANVRATIVPAEAGSRREVRLVIEAVLRVEPDPEHVVFDTVLEVASATFAVTGGADA
jgi:type VI secretion system protein ImpF